MSQASPQESVSPGAEPTDKAGTPTVRSSKLPWIVAAVASLVALVAVGFLVFGPSGSDVTERGSSSPQEAATLFAESFIDGDLETAVSTFATQSLVSNYSFIDHMEWMRAYSPSLGYLPTEHYQATNLEQRHGHIGNALSYLVRSALAPDIDPVQTHVLAEDGSEGMTATDFAAALDPAGLSAFSVVRVDVIEASPGSRFAEQTEQLKAAFGAQDFRTVGILFDTPEGPAALGVEVIQYDGSWYINSLFGSILGTNGNTLTELSSEAEYTQMVEHAQALAQRD